MPEADDHVSEVSRLYDSLAINGPYGTLAPGNKGGRKAEYVAAVFDAALLSSLAAESRHGRILDFGCGTGIFTRQAARVADEVVGIDVSTGMLTQAESICSGLKNVRLLHTDGHHVPLADACVDAVVAREVLCYVPDAQLPHVLAEIRRVTVPRGRFLWLEQVSDDPFWQRHAKAPNLVKRSPRSIRDAARAAGWVVEAEHVVRTPRFPWIYPIWLGIVPRSLIPDLARREVAFHSRRPERHRRRWWNSLFELRNPAND